MMQDRGECPFVYPPQPGIQSPSCRPLYTTHVSLHLTSSCRNAMASECFLFFHTYHMGNNKDAIIIATVPPPTGGLLVLVLDPILVLILPTSTSCSPVLRTPISLGPWPKSMVCLAASARSPWPLMRPVLRTQGQLQSQCQTCAVCTPARLHE